MIKVVFHFKRKTQWHLFLFLLLVDHQLFNIGYIFYKGDKAKKGVNASQQGNITRLNKGSSGYSKDE
jgi:hypothetical protein